MWNKIIRLTHYVRAPSQEDARNTVIRIIRGPPERTRGKPGHGTGMSSQEDQIRRSEQGAVHPLGHYIWRKLEVNL